MADGPSQASCSRPGASASRDQSALVAIDEALAADGVRVERIDFPYRLAGRRAPDRQPVLVASVVAGLAIALLGTCRPAPGQDRPRGPLDGRAHVLDRRRRGPSGGGARARELSRSIRPASPTSSASSTSGRSRCPACSFLGPVTSSPRPTSSSSHGCDRRPGDPCPARERRPRAAPARRGGGRHRRRLGAGAFGASTVALAGRLLRDPYGRPARAATPHRTGPRTPRAGPSSPRPGRPAAHLPPGRHRLTTKRRWPSAASPAMRRFAPMMRLEPL